MKLIAPCKGCKKRYPGCHAKCDDYKAWRKIVDDKQKAIREEKAADDLVRSFLAQSSDNYKKKENKAKKVFHNGD